MVVLPITACRVRMHTAVHEGQRPARLTLRVQGDGQGGVDGQDELLVALAPVPERQR